MHRRSAAPSQASLRPWLGACWGHASGPRADGNPDGQGSTIVGGPVLYDP